MTFLSLILIQFFKAYNFRAFGHSVLKAPFANRWLNLAILGELALLPVIIYVPFLQGPFSTFGLSIADWGIILVLAFSVSPVLELAKAMERRGWFGKDSLRTRGCRRAPRHGNHFSHGLLFRILIQEDRDARTAYAPNGCHPRRTGGSANDPHAAARRSPRRTSS